MTKKFNPFRKYLTKEDTRQEAICEYVQLQYPGALYIHVPNEGKRSKFEQFKMQILGITKGTSDLIFFEPTERYHGLALEVKIEDRHSQLTKEQKGFLKKMASRGYAAAHCKTLEKAIRIIDDYLAGKEIVCTFL